VPYADDFIILEKTGCSMDDSNKPAVGMHASDALCTCNTKSDLLCSYDESDTGGS